jgi:hypothetical protein
LIQFWITSKLLRRLLRVFLLLTVLLLLTVRVLRGAFRVVCERKAVISGI